VQSFDKATGLKTLKWSDLKMKRDDYMLKTFPVSALPQHPAAKLEFVSELSKTGVIDVEDSMELMNFPDIESKMKLQLSPNKLIQRAIESALDKGEYVTPEPYYNLQRAIETGQQYFSWAILQEYPEDRIDMVRRFIDECSSMLAQSQPPSISSTLSVIASGFTLILQEQPGANQILEKILKVAPDMASVCSSIGYCPSHDYRSALLRRGLYC
jgi:hypothetical protein